MSLSKAASALILALLLCPFLYIAAGFLTQFSPIFSVIFIPTTLASVGYLVSRYFLRTLPPKRYFSALLLEIIAWLITVFFMSVLSKVSLNNKFEALGLFSSIYLVSFVLALVIIAFMKKTYIESRFNHLKKTTRYLILASVLIPVSCLSGFWMVSTPSFI